ncbi:spermine oxidase-like [Centruroides sculpturatus]|uniref:spermine oxidase-like n=1 Tax=Centruroides sculpturatus TaxID=218467 RepID=UPI000C6D36B1|nr:spermine oxidase-like [Centruroides sculpturatus]
MAASSDETPPLDDDNENSYKIIIIGGGISGISAANHLIEKGEQSIKILEARNRIGGRIISVPMGDVYVNLGAQWIHGVLGNPVYELAVCNGLLNLTNDQEPHAVVATTEDGKRIPINIVEEIYSAYFWFCKRCEEYFLLRFPPIPEVGNSVGKHLKRDICAYLEQFKDEDKEIRKLIFRHLLNRETCITGCHSMDETGLSDFGSYTELPGGNVTLPGGFASVLEVLIKTLPKDCILKQHSVKHIKWKRESKHTEDCSTVAEDCKCQNINKNIEIECTNGKIFYADHAIVTLPLGVLKTEANEIFIPPLPEYKLESIEKLCFGVVDKIFLRYDRPFLNPEISEILTLWGPTDEKDLSKVWFRKIYSFSKISENIILAWISGKEAEYMETLTEEEISNALTSTLQKFLNDPYIPKPCQVICSSWKSQIYTQGSYTSIGVNSTQRDIELLATPIYANPYQTKPVLLFAGEATHSSFYSTTHGAYLSGQKAADLLVEVEQDVTVSTWDSSKPRCSVGDLSSWLKGIDLT